MVEIAGLLRGAEYVRHPGILDADLIFDRGQLEQEAWELINNQSLIPKPEVHFQEYEDNARTAIMEALTASGHFSKVIVSGTLQEIESQLLGRLLNGWNNNLPLHEQNRRFAEICNLLYGRNLRAAIVAGELPEKTTLLEVSDHPKPLTGLKLGYRDKNKKGMVRSSHLVDKTDGQYNLVIEQVSRSNATSSSTFAFLNACEVKPSEEKPSDLAALEKPLIYNLNDYEDGVVDIIRLLDQYQVTNTLYGDSGVASKNHVSYELLREESERRENEVACFIKDLANLEKQLDGLVTRKQISYQERTQIFNGEIERILAAICTLAPDYAETTFGAKAAPDFYKAAALAAAGHFDQATILLESKSYLRESITFCGSTISVDQADDLGLGVNSYKKLFEKGKRKWAWKSGVCIVQSCPTRPGNTKVGPCNVCEKCQEKYDRGEDPSKKRQLRIKRNRRETPSASRQETNRHIGQTTLRSHFKRQRGDH